MRRIRGDTPSRDVSARDAEKTKGENCARAQTGWLKKNRVKRGGEQELGQIEGEEEGAHDLAGFVAEDAAPPFVPRARDISLYPD